MIQRLAFSSIVIFTLFSCSPQLKGGIQGDVHSTTNKKSIQPTAPDYTSLQYWAAHPLKKDFSDSIPDPLKNDFHYDSSAAVFFVHPTSMTDPQDDRWNASILDEYLVDKTDHSSIQYQASAFNEFPVYAPRYRQAHVRSYYTSDTVKARQAFNLAYHDVRDAFEEFLKENPGRPFFIASHSQGSTHTIRLLKEMIDSTPLQDRLIAAYIIGMAIPDDFKSLKPCTDSTQTGCIVGWRTFKEGFSPAYIDKEKGNYIVINPLTWDTSSTPAPHEYNKGALLRNLHKIYPAAADATIHGNILWVSKLDFPASFLVRRRNLHIGDINLFYMNIRENLRTRMNSYMANRLTLR